MRPSGSSLLLVLTAAALVAATAGAQQTAPVRKDAPPAPSAGAPRTGGDSLPLPNVGDMAPDFAIRGVTRYGLLQSPIRLSQLRGNTVVLAFFPAARTKG